MNKRPLPEIADAFEASVKDVLEPSVIQETRKLILAQDSMPDNSGSTLNWKGSVTGYPLVLEIKIKMDTHKFKAYGGGLGSIGSLSISGPYTFKDQAALDDLIKNTHSIQYNFGPTFSNINFFSSNSRPLASFVGDATGALAAIGGGKGSWKAVS